MTPASSGAAPKAPPAGRGWPVAEPLPPAAEDTRQAILSAVHSGAIEELEVAYELGDQKPDIGQSGVADPVAHWKKLSADGEGREVLAVLGNLLSVGAAQVAMGRDPENNAVYVWPYLAELPLDKLTAAQQVDLLRLMPATEAKAIMAGKTWTWWRLTIGADGQWHVFKKGS